MRFESIKKRSGQLVKIRPALQVYDDSAVLQDTVEDAWFISQITDDSLTVQSRDTQHTKKIGLDHVHNYMADPEGHPAHGTTGTLVLNVQLLLFEGALLAEPVAPPGTPLKVFVPARPRASLINAAAKMRAEQELRQVRHEFAWSRDGVEAADKAFAEIPTSIAQVRDELRNAGHEVDIQVRDIGWGNMLLKVAGWWVVFSWRKRAVNCIENSFLTFTQYDGPPRLPQLMAFEEPHVVSTERFTFGLAALNQPRWLSVSDDSLSYTTMGLVQHLVTRLMEQPNIKPR